MASDQDQRRRDFEAGWQALSDAIKGDAIYFGKSDAASAYLAEQGVTPPAAGPTAWPCSVCGCEERDHRGILTCRCPSLPAAEPSTREVLEQALADFHCRIQTMLTPRLNNPEASDVLDVIGHANEAFKAKLAALSTPSPQGAQTQDDHKEHP